MRITSIRLRQLIREELNRLDEAITDLAKSPSGGGIPKGGSGGRGKAKGEKKADVTLKSAISIFLRYAKDLKLTKKKKVVTQKHADQFKKWAENKHKGWYNKATAESEIAEWMILNIDDVERTDF